MASSTIQSAGRAPDIVFDRLAVVYNRVDGDILHIHRVTSTSEARAPSEDDLRRAALHHAGRLCERKGVEQAEVLLASPGDLRPGMRHCVDPAARKLVCRPREGRPDEEMPPDFAGEEPGPEQQGRTGRRF